MLKFRPCRPEVLPCQVFKGNSHMRRKQTASRNWVNNPQRFLQVSHQIALQTHQFGCLDDVDVNYPRHKSSKPFKNDAHWRLVFRKGSQGLFKNRQLIQLPFKWGLQGNVGRGLQSMTAIVVLGEVVLDVVGVVLNVLWRQEADEKATF